MHLSLHILEIIPKIDTFAVEESDTPAEEWDAVDEEWDAVVEESNAAASERWDIVAAVEESNIDADKSEIAGAVEEADNAVAVEEADTAAPFEIRKLLVERNFATEALQIVTVVENSVVEMASLFDFLGPLTSSVAVQE